MNVIIRLQNLPWSANATDIRNFFKGLMIPEGGVHIVGGENGDAFIAFSTDEDARQAMQLNGGKIKEIQVSLLLSSRAEMQKVIEKARQASTFMNKVPPTAQPPAVLPASVIANQFANKAPEQQGNPMIAPQPPVISLTNFLTQSMQNQNPQQLAMMSAYQQAMPQNNISKLAGVAPVGMQPNTAAAAAVYANYYATLMDPNAMNHLNTMPAVKQSDVDQNAAYFTPNSDPRNRRENPREINSYKRQISRSPDRKGSRRSRSNSRERDSDGKDSGSRRRTRFSDPNDRAGVPNVLKAPPKVNNSPVGYSVPPPVATVTNNVWEHPPPQIFGNERMATANAFPNFNNGPSAQPPTRNYQTESKPADFGNIGTAIKVSNVGNDVYYSDLRQFFSGLPIGNDDIKFVTDIKGNRTGMVFVRFLTQDAKKKALTKDMWQLKSTQVMITPISEDEFVSGHVKGPSRVSNYREDNHSDNRNDRGDYRNDRGDYKNDRGDYRNDHRNDRYRDRSGSRERDHQRNFNRHDGGGNYRNNRFENNRQHQGGNFRRDQDRNPRNFRREEPQEKPKVYEPDQEFTVLIIDDIPRTASEPDICEAFPNILSMVIEKTTAYVRFTTHDAAKVTLENRFIHYICNKRVFLEAGSLAQFNDMVKKHGKYDNPETAGTVTEDPADQESRDKPSSDVMNEDSNSRDNSSSSRDQKPFEADNNSRDPRPYESRDPRQRNFNNGNGNFNDRNSNFNNSNFNNDRFGGHPNMMRTDCVIVKNMEVNTTIGEVENFFKDIGIFKMVVHILLDKRGQPCGDCFVVFKYPNDAQRATEKNNQMLKNNRVTVMLIPREQVDAVLGSFGGDDPSRNLPPIRGGPVSNKWSPPPGFGNPGCVIMISNLCYRATVEDLLREFQEYSYLTPNHIIRRFNEYGKPTGMACVNFNSPQDAEQALEKYNNVQIQGRTIWLKRA